MSKGILVAVVGVVLLGGVGLYYMNQSRTPGSESATETSSTEQADESSNTQGAFTGSFKELATRGGDWKCVIQASANTGSGEAISEGVVYVSGKKMRGDFVSTVEGTRMESHMISDGEYSYTWSSAYPQGFKMKITESGTGNPATSGQGMDANQEYSYDCDPASSDTALFVPPQSVTFMSL